MSYDQLHDALLARQCLRTAMSMATDQKARWDQSSETNLNKFMSRHREVDESYELCSMLVYADSVLQTEDTLLSFIFERANAQYARLTYSGKAYARFFTYKKEISASYEIILLLVNVYQVKQNVEGA